LVEKKIGDDFFANRIGLNGIALVSWPGRVRLHALHEKMSMSIRYGFAGLRPVSKKDIRRRRSTVIKIK
jgi:hypothetical protein